jgi:hypothetical protein
MAAAIPIGAVVLLVAALAAVVAVAAGTVKAGDFWNAISAAVAISVLVLVCGSGSAVVWALINGRIDLRYLLSEPGAPDAAGKSSHKASLSRFQFLIFTFVIAGLYLALSLEKGTLVEIPANVLLLLGISSTTYGASKGISEFGPTRGTTGNPAPDPAPAPAAPAAPDPAPPQAPDVAPVPDSAPKPDGV